MLSEVQCINRKRHIFLNVALALHEGREKGKVQESIQSSTTADPEHHMKIKLVMVYAKIQIPCYIGLSHIEIHCYKCKQERGQR